MQDIDMRLNKLIRYSEPKNNKETLFIWPEGVFSGYTFDEIKIFKKKFTQNFKKNHFILFGINRYDDEKKGVYNSMLVINNQLEIVGEYRKQKLVPFGEFLPLEKLLGIIGLKKLPKDMDHF